MAIRGWTKSVVAAWTVVALLGATAWMFEPEVDADPEPPRDGASVATSHETVPTQAANVAAAFVPNLGQLDASILWSAQLAGVEVGLVEDGLLIAAEGEWIHVRWPGADATHAHGVGDTGAYSNYYGTRTAENVPRYVEVLAPSFLDGIDLRLYMVDGEFEFDLIAAPGAALEATAFAVERATKVRLEDNVILADTQRGTFTLRAPVLYQGSALVDGAYVLDGTTVRFKVGAFDATKPLVLDPKIGYATWFGGTGFDPIYSATASNEGNDILYVMGQVSHGTLPMVNSWDNTWNSLMDVFVAKFDLSKGANALLWSTYLGGSGNDYGFDIASHWDPATSTGRVHVVGDTRYSAAIAYPTMNAYRAVPNGGGYNAGFNDVFLSSFDHNGQLVYSTLWGGAGWDYSHAVTTDADGLVYVVGYTEHNYAWSNGYKMPTTQNAVQPVHSGDVPASTSITYDGFLAVFDTKQNNLASLVYSTFLGGGNTEVPRGVSVDANKNAYVAGYVSSCCGATWAMPSGANKATPVGMDGWVVKVPTTGPAPAGIPWGTYYGGTSTDYVEDVSFYDGHVYLAGYTYSSGLTGASGTYDTTLSTTPDGFVAKLDPSTTGSAQVVAASYLGANGNEFFCCDIEVTSHGVTVAGTTNFCCTVTGNTFPSVKASSTIQLGYGYDLFISRFQHDLEDLIYSLRHGSTTTDNYNFYLRHPLAVAPDGWAMVGTNAYYSAAGIVSTTQGYSPYQASGGTNCCPYHGWIVKLAPAPPEAKCTAPPSVVRGLPSLFTAANSKEMDYPLVSYEWWITKDSGVEYSGPLTAPTYTTIYPVTETLTAKSAKVRITDSNGWWSENTCTYTVQNAPPIADFVMSPTPAWLEYVITFDAGLSLDQDWDGAAPFKGITETTWTMTPATGWTCATVTTVTLDCTFTLEGTYLMQLQVKDAAGATAIAWKEFDVVEEPIPVPDFAHSGPAFSCGAAIPIKFVDDSLPAQAPLMLYEWDFDDDGLIDSTLPQLTFALTPGKWPVTLKVTATDGGYAEVTKIVDIIWATPPKASFLEKNSQAPYYLNQPMKFQYNGAAGSTPISSYDWTVDGKAVAGTAGTLLHEFAEGGAHVVELTVKDTAGCTDTFSQAYHIVVFDEKTAPAPSEVVDVKLGPSAAFVASDLEVVVGDVIAFTDESVAGLVPIATWKWAFADGTVQETANAQHRFARPGTYVVSLLVTDTSGRSDTATASIVVRAAGDPGFSFPNGVPRPVANAGVDLIVAEGSAVHLDGQASQSPLGEALRFQWMQVQGPAVALLGAGTDAPSFRAPLLGEGDGQVALVFDLVVNDGRSASHPDTVVVRVRPAEAADFTYELTKTGLLTATALQPARELSWDFGDGTVAYGLLVSHAYAKSGTYTVTLTAETDGGIFEQSERIDVQVPKEAGRHRATQTDLGAEATFAGFTPGTWVQVFLGVAAVAGATLYVMSRKK